MAELSFCVVTTFYPPYSFGGDGVSAQRLATALADRGYRVRVIHARAAHRLLGGAPNAEDKHHHPGVEVVACPTTVTGVGGTYLTGQPLGYRRRLESLMCGHDVVHFLNPSLLGGPGAVELSRGLTVYTTSEHWLLCPTHTLFRYGREVCTKRTCWRCSLSYRRPPQPWRSSGLLERAVGSVDLMLSPSQFTAELHRAAFGPVRIDVVPPLGPAPPPASSTAPQPTGDQTRPYFAYVGRLEPIKGVDRLIDAFRFVRGADLVVVGTGSLADELREVATSDPDVRFLGQVPNAEVPRILAGARALVVPSVGYETFGMVGAEAMSVGTPVVVRDLGPLPELVEEGGGLVFGDEAGLTATLQRLVDEPALAPRLGEEARRAYRRRFAPQVVLARYLAAVASAADAAGAPDLAARLRRAVGTETA